MAALSILAIKNYRAEFHRKNESNDDEKDISGIAPIDRPVKGTAYIIRQFKRKEEITHLRAVYGKKFIQISAHASQADREKSIVRRIAKATSNLTRDEIEEVAKQLINRDYNESKAPHGQRVKDVFYRGDVFVNAKSEATAENTITRFIQAFFGKNSISPEKHEYGAYIAASASLRSIDTSRQIGAAIFTDAGEIIAMGSNEVPKAGGGTYWPDGEIEPHRDFDDKRDPNSVRKRRIMFDLLDRLNTSGFLKDSRKLSDERYSSIIEDRAIRKSLLNDITEYGRMAHAEMNAITDAARLGRATKDAILFSTTFPCHNCAKHIVAAGIKEVIFIEPYPKSQAIKLNDDSICIEEDNTGKVVFKHFVGISPKRYRDIFEKGKRRDNNGNFKEWYENEPAPRVTDRGAGYVLNESSAIYSVLDKVFDELSPIDDE